MSEPCGVCLGLWKEYEVATRAYLKVISDQQIAALHYDGQALQLLDERHQIAGALRADIRQALTNHQLAVHGDSQLATTPLAMTSRPSS